MGALDLANELTNKPGDRIVGRHVYGNLYGVEPSKLWDEDFLRELVREAAEIANMKVVELRSWKFTGYHGGVSVMALVLESHITIHTWPDYEYATVDVYTCGEKGDPWRAFHLIVEKLQPEDYTVHFSDRSSRPRRPRGGNGGLTQ
ncbi:MAG: adenosylmethionine decarboxylase [Crenarchaeota archaeon]|nr:adenosylmethionine decarboxylase [Thermoproteota archaeon]